MTPCSAGGESGSGQRRGFMTAPPRGPAKTGYGNNWVVLAVRVRLPMVSRPVAVPVMAKLVIKGTTSASRLWLARRMVTRLAAGLPGRRVHVTADSAYAGEELKQLPDGRDLDHQAPLQRRAS